MFLKIQGTAIINGLINVCIVFISVLSYMSIQLENTYLTCIFKVYLGRTYV